MKIHSLSGMRVTEQLTVRIQLSTTTIREQLRAMIVSAAFLCHCDIIIRIWTLTLGALSCSLTVAVQIMLVATSLTPS